MAFNPPPPTGDRSQTRQVRAGSGAGGGLQSLVQAEKLMQIALLLPCAAVIGWGIGWWIDHHFGWHWATIAGLILGLVSGMVSVIRMALTADNGPRGKQ
jgi:F0F1-type ATP synthase assembly protein I